MRATRQEQAMDQVGAIPQEVDEEPAEFSAVLTPHRSLSPRGFLIFMAIISVISFTAGMAFFMAGAWPVLGFFGLDVLLIYGAFKLNYYAARAYETVSIYGNQLVVTKVLPSGRSKSWTFNPYWARVELISLPGRASRLLVTSHGRRLVLGAFLSEGERQDFATSLRNALAASKGQLVA
jgi:uncharacterized membrane protein